MSSEPSGPVVPIEQLFYDDGRPGLVEAGTPSPAVSMIDTTIAALQALNERTLGEPAPLPEDEVVPIETLLYTGRGALDRAAELRDELRQAGHAPNPADVEELFDLLDLARAG